MRLQIRDYFLKDLKVEQSSLEDIFVDLVKEES